MTYITLTLALTPLLFVLGLFSYIAVAASEKTTNLRVLSAWNRFRVVAGIALAIVSPVAYLGAFGTWGWGMFISAPWAACL